MRERKQWRTAPVIIACGGIILLLSIGIRFSFGIFLQPISLDLGWSRDVFAFSIALQNLFWGVSQPFPGAIADRYGTGRVVVAGALLYAAGTMLMATATTPAAAHITAGVMVGIGLGGCGISIVLAAVGCSVAPERRGMAMGVTAAAGSFGQFAVLPVGQKLHEAYGWPMTFFLLGLASLLIVPLAAALAGRDRSAAKITPGDIGAAVGEAERNPSFLYLNAGYFVCGFHVAFIATHLPAYIVDQGMPASLGAWALGLVGLFNVFGVIISGLLGDRFSKKYLLSSIYFARAVIITVFVLVPVSEASILLFAATMGLFWLSTVPLTSALVAQMFGTRYLSTLLGVVFFSHQLGSFTSAWLGGELFALTGSYAFAWWVSVALGIFASLLHWPIDERPIARFAGAE